MLVAIRKKFHKIQNYIFEYSSLWNFVYFESISLLKDFTVQSHKSEQRLSSTKKNQQEINRNQKSAKAIGLIKNLLITFFIFPGNKRKVSESFPYGNIFRIMLNLTNDVVLKKLTYYSQEIFFHRFWEFPFYEFSELEISTHLDKKSFQFNSNYVSK